MQPESKVLGNVQSITIRVIHVETRKKKGKFFFPCLTVGAASRRGGNSSFKFEEMADAVRSSSNDKFDCDRNIK